MLLEEQGYPEEDKMLHNAVRNSLDIGKTTTDLSGMLSMAEVEKAIVEYIRSWKS